mmetsp:Transcript_11969/g.34298  ORF Transcript_11969/g.34298 Transcript_11969/m.34298 type:complete len:289 (+) Transcript_11969:97-963(+)
MAETIHSEVCTPMFGCLLVDGCEDDNNVGKDIFSMVLDDAATKTRFDRREEHIWNEQSTERVRRRMSKRYSRPIFREPGSKIRNKSLRKIDHDRYTRKRDKEIEKSSDLLNRVFGEHQSTYVFSNPSEVEEQTIKDSSCRAKNSESVVSRPVDRYNVRATNQSVIVGTRLLQRMQKLQRQRGRHVCVRDSDIDSESESVVSVSDLDSLESKKLRRNTPQRNLYSLRKEIDTIVGSSLDKMEKSESEKEERQEWTTSDGCVADGCVSFLHDGGPGMQDFFNDVKAYWIL